MRVAFHKGCSYDIGTSASLFYFRIRIRSKISLRFDLWQEFAPVFFSELMAFSFLYEISIKRNINMARLPISMQNVIHSAMKVVFISYKAPFTGLTVVLINVQFTQVEILEIFPLSNFYFVILGKG